MIPAPESRTIATRAYATPVQPAKLPTRKQGGRSSLSPSAWTLTFDTETTTDAAQQLRFGVYQVRHGDDLHEEGLFYDPLTLTDADRSLFYGYASARGLMVRTVEDFIDGIFLRYLFDLRGTCIGFNLPFDLSRLAIAHAPARGRTMHGGFSFRLCPDKRRPRIQVKHLTGRAALIRFTVPGAQPTPRGMRRRGLRVHPWRGAFVDVRTLAGALLSGPWSLASLADHLQTQHRKHDTDEHGGPLTEQYLDYACNDVQVTWECFQLLHDRYTRYGLSQTPIHRIYSEASLGKACLREMGIHPWREQQPDVPPELLGVILSTYYGGRSEVHLRRVISRVLYCDFLSMYPTVCTLMGLWAFVTGERLAWTDATDDARTFLEEVTIEDLQDPETWRQLTTLVEVIPTGDLFPVRSKYDDGVYTIGLNHLTGDRPLWFTLADCAAARILTGRVPTIVRALRFSPMGCQADLTPLDVVGNPAYRVDPVADDFYRQVIDLRGDVKRDLTTAGATGDHERAAQLDTEQLALKIMANATSYGIFVELNVTTYAKPQPLTCCGNGDPFATRTPNVEEPGRFFHPLLGTLITGAARLMLAMAERLATDAGLDWAFCDTDSMALAKPGTMAEAEFLVRAGRVGDWFAPLNPYATKGPLCKVEDANYRLSDGKTGDAIEPLCCFAISAKRYVLFGLDERGRPVLRKASAHGLGHLRPPYGEDAAPASIPPPPVSLRELGVERWQYDLWYRIVEAALTGKPAQVRLDDLPGFGTPAVSRYAATTPTLLRWFDSYNADKPYRERVRPFGFLLNFQRDPLAPLPWPGTPSEADVCAGSKNNAPRPVATFDLDPVVAAERCFDRVTGARVPRQNLKTYRQALAQYHLHPEAKFADADFTDAGPTTRRHVRAVAVEHIGKEANRWEEQLYLGEDPETQIVYGAAPEDRERLRGNVLRAGRRFEQRALAEAAGVSVREVGTILRGERRATRETLAKLARTVPRLEAAERERAEHERAVLDGVRARGREGSTRRFAALAGVHYPHLTEVLAGRRRPSRAMLAQLEAAVRQTPSWASARDLRP